MNSFIFRMPVEICLGENCVRNNEEIFRTLGERALIITYDLPAPARHYALEDVTAVLDKIGTKYMVNLDVVENPPVSSVKKIAEEALKMGEIDYIIGVGGGSAIDTAKCVSLLLKYGTDNEYGVLFSKEKLEGIPLVAIPTTCGTGSECTRWASVTREDTNNKGSISVPVFARYAFVDARYIVELPRSLTCFTALDALCHCAEVYLTAGAGFFSKTYGEMGMKLFAEYKDALSSGKYTMDQREKMMLCATIGGIAISQAMSALPHGLSKPISLSTHMPHGLACAINLVPYMRLFQDQTEVEKVVGWCGFQDLDEMDAFMQGMLGEYMEKYSCTDKDIENWAEEIFLDKRRLSTHPEEVTKEMLVKMCREAFHLDV